MRTTRLFLALGALAAFSVGCIKTDGDDTADTADTEADADADADSDTDTDSDADADSYSSATGTLVVTRGFSTTPGDTCDDAYDLSSGSASDCPDCEYSFDFSFALSASADCGDDGGGFEGAVIPLGFNSDYAGYGAYIMYGYYGSWYPVFGASGSADSASFERVDYQDYPYTYNGVQYYYTSIWSGTMAGQK